MSSNKNISRRIKKEILNNDCDYDTLYNELLMYPEEVLSGILNSYLYLFRNITTINNLQSEVVFLSQNLVLSIIKKEPKAINIILCYFLSLKKEISNY